MADVKLPKPGQSFELKPSKRIEGRYFIRLDVDAVWDATHSIHPGITTIHCFGYSARGRKRVRLMGISIDDFTKLVG